jgi:1,4-dihydroxy-2-naphthoyl-CoA hydrolase
MSDQSRSSKPPVSALDFGVSVDGDFSAALNGRLGGWVAAMGVRFVRATSDEVTAEIEVGPQHHQGYGIVHGGVYSGLIETVASVGAALWAMSAGQSVVGLENHTSFLNAVREGKLTVMARPRMRGRRTQVWEATVTDGRGRSVAHGTVRLLSLESDSLLAGKAVRLQKE